MLPLPDMGEFLPCYLLLTMSLAFDSVSTVGTF
jgi:hypothetical protein